jgi:hypothetical protein
MGPERPRGRLHIDTRTETLGGLNCARLAMCSQYRGSNITSFWVMTEPERHRSLILFGTLPASCFLLFNGHGWPIPRWRLSP